MGDITPLNLPPDLPYPINVTRVMVEAGTKVRRGDRMLEYSFLSATRRKELDALATQGRDAPAEMRKNDMVGSWESPVDGEIVSWEPTIKPGAQIERRHASKPVVRIEQPCTHPVQFNGMCGVCGANIINDDYLSRPEQNEAGPSRYPGSFEIAHDASGVTVSTNEAKRLETQTRDTLLAERKLSLIVDLDQTIIHTTVDPTVGEWLDECAEDAKADAAQREKEHKDYEGDDKMDGSGEGESTTTPPGSPNPKREPNPNAEALKDVARFQLAEDLPPAAAKGRGRGQPPARWYYTKPRPGLNDFLNDLSKLYEMHVYTMGTRTYADAICNIIDPDGRIFGGRILSRDESGSMSSKSLMRLFPTDQSMVVIIDDRSDVWGDSPNLLKVVPYDFFIGIGDINGSFLPPTQPAITMPPGQPQTPGSDRASSAASTPPPATPSDIPSTEDGLMRQSKILDEMTELRPLAKLEKENDEKDDEGEDEAVGHEAKGENARESPAKDGDDPKDKVETDNDKPHVPHVLHLRHPHHRKALLNPTDFELDRVGGILRTIHKQYYEAYDERDPSSESLPMQCDAPLLIQELKDQVLQGCVIAFTGVIPRNVRPERAEIWQLAEAFGAICVHDLSDRLTHLVTASLGTEKMYRASKMPGVKTVWLAWLQSCIALWQHEPEGPFRAAHPSVEEPREPSPPPRKEKEEEVNGEDEDEEIRKDSAAFDAAWDEAAQAEFDKFLEDADDSDGSSTADGRDFEGLGGDGKPADADGNPVEGEERDGSESPKSPTSVIDNDERHEWSRASTPGPSILSGAPSPGRETPKSVVWADDENQPLERIREPQPGELVSYPPRKKRKVLMLAAPTADDDIPEANRMVYRAKPSWQNGAETPSDDDGGDGEGHSDRASSAGDEDEFAQMLSDSLADEQ